VTDNPYRTLSFWHDSLPGPLTARPPLRGAHRADVAIVGAGYTGLWAAWHLKQQEPSLEVAVVEAETAGFGASGRNGGWCSAFLSGIEHWLDDPAQRDGALRLQRLMFDTVGEVGRFCEDQAVDAHYERSGALQIAVNAAQVERLQAELDYLRGLGFGEDDYRWLDRDAIQTTLAVDRARAAVHLPHCAALHPARLARGLAERVEQTGVTIFEDSPVLDCGPGRLLTAQGRLTARTVLVATEGYGVDLDARARRLIPVHSMMVVTEPLPEPELADLRFGQRYCFGNLDHVVTYGQRTADNRIAFGCRGRYFYGSGLRQRFDPDGPEFGPEFDRVRATLLRFFPRLREVRFTHAWGGALGVSRTLRPAVCFNRERRTGWAGGYFGNGVAAAHLAGRTLADLVLERDTECTRTPWVNPPEATRAWEPEPLRWLGFRATRALMERTDRAEYRNSPSAPALRRILQTLLG
jgi:glycine/D-amino acid oxidase-like deaminating enzyme